MSVKYDYAGRYVDGRAVRLVPNVNVHLERFAAYYEAELGSAARGAGGREPAGPLPARGLLPARQGT